MIGIGAILFIIGVVIIITTTDCDYRVLVGAFLVAAGTIIFVCYDHPTAMDVYRGKTTLEITYKDGVATDSVVVLKNKEE